MRGVLRALLALSCVAALACAGCDAPPSAQVGAAEVDPPPTREPLPALVSATVRKLLDIAETGSYRDLAAIADAVPGFRSNNASMSHSDYWYLEVRAGDWPMAQVGKLLGYRFTVADSARGKVYIWPWVATLKPDEITPAAARDIDKLLGEGQAEALRRGGVWPGYVLGIAEDGQWLYFVSGSG